MEPKKKNSAVRIRIGVGLLLIWWIPFWAIIPAIVKDTNPSVSTAQLTTFIVIVQTIIGLAGGYIAGREVTDLVKSSGLKGTPKAIWRVFWHGSAS